MKFTDNASQAADYLRQAVPLMVKYNIPPNPLNYALWYTYVSERLPKLNARLDEALDTYGTCPNVVSEQIFRDHLIREEIGAADEQQEALLALINQLGSHATETAAHTENYSTVLEDSLLAFDRPDDQLDALPLEAIIRNLAANTREISETTREFQRRIDDAQAEIESLRSELNKTRQDAHFDPLTGLYNRRVFDSELEQFTQLEQAGKLTLVMLDVDHFKRFNDSYGHLMGDKVLQYVGRLLRESCPDPMMAIRFGGEEFAVMMPGSKLADGIELAERLRAKIHAIRIKQKRSGDVISSITASFGVSQLQPGDSAGQLIDRADGALYNAKKQGRNRVVTG
ncbi:GGDEF domain-containing protein [Marinobacterium arenosum]|uniref:GGDEF domain-containing protein n=1 Tax=Marinobacterium arenosum TaxID=2862496 RepID=UPI001C981237|nr:GGDEF domain-containing protein [Marinobacterium arenosum]MBY4677797.1 GGDEF domain-containing protein [Marinobacterium arenosum]